MKIAIFDTHKFEKSYFETANQQPRAHSSTPHRITWLDARLNSQTARLAVGHDAVGSFVNDRVDAETCSQLAALGVRLIALRCAGTNHVDLQAARLHKLQVVRVPEYSPHAVAEHAVALLLTLNRKIHRAHNRVREMNFSLDGLVGFDLYKKTVGVIGVGRIGQVFAQIMSGFGTEVLLFDPQTPTAFAAKVGARVTSLEELLQRSDVISLHCPLNEQTRHMLDAQRFYQMKPGAMIVNTGRGALIETRALIQALKSGRLGGAALDVYEEEAGVFFEDLSERGVNDDQLARLLTFPNVLITSHQAFLTHEALTAIAQTTLQSLDEFESGRPLSSPAFTSR
jgi:D-lactate dehydrogenase